ncbi:MAG: AEC family transporter [Thermoanaerobacteraceae bacterium]|nr:AEC family transporter [Thermoanaerobacteraceae bacterium]
MTILVQVIIPVFLVFLLGYTGQKVFSFDIKSISTTALYIMTPALVFRTFYETKLDSTYLYIMVYGLLLSGTIILLIKGLAVLRGYEESLTSGLILATAFMNNGNFGAPVILFAFGERAFQYAVAIMLFHMLIMSTAGIYYAAKGKFPVTEALGSVVKMPIVHAAVLGLVWQYFQLPVPGNLYKTVDMVADAAIPTIMLVLGMQLAEIRTFNLDWGKAALALAVRLLISPLIAWGIVLLLPVESILAKVMIVEAAMPTAAITTMYALQYDSSPDLVSSITFISTLLSIVTLSVLLSFLV